MRDYIVHEAVMNSGIKFDNINFRTEARGGVRPGVSSDPKYDKNWSFPKAGRTELDERMLVATSVQIGVIAVITPINTPLMARHSSRMQVDP